MKRRFQFVAPTGNTGRFLRVPNRSKTKKAKWFDGSATNTDINERKATEDELRRTNAALQQANSDLEQFAYSASHDLQEPLRNVSIYSQMLKKKYGGRLDEQADLYIGFAVDGAQRMELRVRDLLEYTQAGSSRKRPKNP